MQDARIGLFLDQNQKDALDGMLSSVTPLWEEKQLYYYDRFADRDDYGNPDYRKHFQTLMAAILDRTYVDILYESRFGHRVRHIYLPCRLEYSIKNDCFRLLAVESHRQRNPRVEILNLSRIQAVTLTSKTAGKLPDINRILSRSYHREPARILIKDRRNALERAMLQFANYEKSTRRIDADTYECLIYYNKKMETELLIEVLSFGPMIQVVGNKDFLRLLKERLARQKAMLEEIS